MAGGTGENTSNAGGSAAGAIEAPVAAVSSGQAKANGPRFNEEAVGHPGLCSWNAAGGIGATANGCNLPRLNGASVGHHGLFSWNAPGGIGGTNAAISGANVPQLNGSAGESPGLFSWNAAGGIGGINAAANERIILQQAVGQPSLFSWNAAGGIGAINAAANERNVLQLKGATVGHTGLFSWNAAGEIGGIKEAANEGNVPQLKGAAIGHPGIFSWNATDEIGGTNAAISGGKAGDTLGRGISRSSLSYDKRDDATKAQSGNEEATGEWMNHCTNDGLQPGQEEEPMDFGIIGADQSIDGDKLERWAFHQAIPGGADEEEGSEETPHNQEEKDTRPSTRRGKRARVTHSKKTGTCHFLQLDKKVGLLNILKCV